MLALSASGSKASSLPVVTVIYAAVNPLPNTASSMVSKSTSAIGLLFVFMGLAYLNLVLPREGAVRGRVYVSA